MTDRQKRRSTTIAEGGRRKEWRRRLVNVPVERASTILFDSVAELEGGHPQLGEYRYGLQGTATHWALSEALTELEPGAAGTALYSSGLAAISGALLSILAAGDELLVTDSVYGPTRTFCDTVLKRFGVTTRYYDPLIGSKIAEVVGPSTRAILLESPGSMTMEIQDVPAICAVARDRGIVTLLDNTWATPLFFPAIAAGIDITMGDIDGISRRVPCVCKVAPNGTYLMEDVHRAGGIPAILGELHRGGLLHEGVSAVHAPNLRAWLGEWDIRGGAASDTHTVSVQNGPTTKRAQTPSTKPPKGIEPSTCRLRIGCSAI